MFCVSLVLVCGLGQLPPAAQPSPQSSTMAPPYAPTAPGAMPPFAQPPVPPKKGMPYSAPFAQPQSPAVGYPGYPAQTMATPPGLAAAWGQEVSWQQERTKCRWVSKKRGLGAMRGGGLFHRKQRTRTTVRYLRTCGNQPAGYFQVSPAGVPVERLAPDGVICNGIRSPGGWVPVDAPGTYCDAGYDEEGRRFTLVSSAAAAAGAPSTQPTLPPADDIPPPPPPAADTL